MDRSAIITLSVGHDRGRKGASWSNRHEFDVMQKLTAGVESKLVGRSPRIEVVRVPTPLRSGVYFSRVNDDLQQDRLGPTFSTLPQKTNYINGVVTNARSSGDPVKVLNVEFHLNASPANQRNRGVKAQGTEILLYGLHDRVANGIAHDALEHYCSLLQTRTGHVVKNRGIKPRPDLWFLKKTLGTAWIWELWFIDDPAAMVIYDENPELFHEIIAAVLFQSIR